MSHTLNKPLLILGLVLLLLTSCHGDPPMVVTPNVKGNDLKENMINANRTIARTEETSIDQYVARRGWSMTRLPEGARIMEYEVGKGAMVQYEDSVCVDYSVEALNGKMIYEGVSECFVAGRRQQMIGLDQAVLNLHFGSHAKVILPSHLAYGIGGDGDRIPQSTILVLDLEVKNKRLKD